MGNDSKKTKKFLKLPTYPGGKEALVKFLMENIKYPDEARKNKVEGVVHISYDVDHSGKITAEKVIHGIGYGCDEEALRLVKLLKYNSTYNRGSKVKKRMKLRIPFTMKPQKMNIMYNYVEHDTEEEDSTKDDNNTYGYTIRF